MNFHNLEVENFELGITNEHYVFVFHVMSKLYDLDISCLFCVILIALS